MIGYVRASVLAITKNGIIIGRRLGSAFPEWRICAPEKLSDESKDIEWFCETTSSKIGELFKTSEALICIFSLGAVIRLIAPHLKDKKTDPAVIVIDDKADHVISALSGHIGGANQLANDIAEKLGAVPVITTAADVNKTIAVDMIGRKLGWQIEDGSSVTTVSAMMVNEEKIGIYQDAGQRDWLKEKMPVNVTIYTSMPEMSASDAAGLIIITDKIIKTDRPAVTLRPKSLIAGIGLHQNTTIDTIERGLDETFRRHKLSRTSISRIATVKKPSDVPGLEEFARKYGIKTEHIERTELAKVETPNPSQTVKALEGTPSVSEAAAILASKGNLIVEKQKFPPDLTVAVARMVY